MDKFEFLLSANSGEAVDVGPN